ncbi:pentatricopeptide repeat-containing protein At2g20710, mitochondrial-like [Cornus florida]|uniref:pentatricopeptide repeat-containing protein At2g20710, mitochondrial-like n=1 Tax=Cornus florida TaxID=4283 RepID=UPI0028987929|nr:pentatricopeptide repeat-containing protein At2g20710, mitochondrial-like [Cornus florida]
MKCMQSSSFFRFLFHRQNCGVLVSPFSTKTPNLSPFSPVKALYDQIQIVCDPRASIIPVLDKWVEQGRSVGNKELRSLIHLMKDFNRFNHALEISKWMTDRRYFILSPADVAVRLELISTVHGIEHAENYFNNISNSLKSATVYGALLSSYVRQKSIAKAEAVMQNMREMGFATTSFPYNLLINLYAQTEEHDKIDALMQEMENLGIPHDMFTLRNRMNAYVRASDISGVEKILNRIEEDPNYVFDWIVYSLAANAYLKVGLIEKTLAMLNKMEGIMIPVKSKLAFQYLLSLYASIGSKNELYRVWNLYKPLNEVHGTSYSVMITSLAKLDDIEGAEKIFQEWESRCSFYDFRILNRLLVAYCKKGLFDKAELAVKKAIKGRTPYASTWYILAVGYSEDKQMDKAAERLKKALLVGRKGWRPRSVLLDASLEYLEGQGDVKEIEEIITLLKNTGALTRNNYHSLLRAFVRIGKSVSDVLDQMERDGFTANEETHRILEMRPSLM